jgi:hypothetical protein
VATVPGAVATGSSGGGNSEKDQDHRDHDRDGADSRDKQTGQFDGSVVSSLSRERTDGHTGRGSKEVRRHHSDDLSSSGIRNAALH